MCRRLHACNHHLRIDTVIISYSDQLPQQYDPQCSAACKNMPVLNHGVHHLWLRCRKVHKFFQNLFPVSGGDTQIKLKSTIMSVTAVHECSIQTKLGSAVVNVIPPVFYLIYLVSKITDWVSNHKCWLWPKSAIHRLGSITGGQARDFMELYLCQFWAWWDILSLRL